MCSRISRALGLGPSRFVPNWVDLFWYPGTGYQIENKMPGNYIRYAPGAAIFAGPRVNDENGL